MNKRRAWVVTVGAAGVIAVASTLGITAGTINQRGLDDARQAEAACAEFADGGTYELTWDLVDIPSNWECSWSDASDGSGGMAVIAWNTFADR